MMIKRKFPQLLALVVLSFSSCEQQPPATSEALFKREKPVVFAANQPLAYFAQRIGGTQIEVLFNAPPDEDPAFWQPSESQMQEIQNADLLLMNGATYSKWAEKATLPESKLVDTSEAFKSQFIKIAEGVSHSHGKEGEHSHGGVAFTTWLDFNQAAKQAEAVKDALVRLKPEQVELFALNYDLLQKELLGWDARLHAAGKKLAGQPLVASHPIYQYWARRYQFNVREVLWEPEIVPVEADLEALKALLVIHPAKWMIWEGEPAKESAEKVKALGLESVVFDPAFNKPEQGSWKDVMEANVKAMEALAGI
jgi:zinc transport system substrate-binding protein